MQEPSKTQRKREMHALQALGDELVALNDGELERIELPDALREAVLEAKRIRSREGLRRQLQFIGRLMRDVDAQAVRAQLELCRGRSNAAIAIHHQCERWRTELLADDAAFAAFAREYPRADLQALRAAVRATRLEQTAGKPPRNFRELFRLIRAAVSPTEGESSGEASPI
jgi:ribosome-associated protein